MKLSIDVFVSSTLDSQLSANHASFCGEVYTVTEEENKSGWRYTAGKQR